MTGLREGKVVVVFGASGFIGRQCVNNLLGSKGVYVHAVARQRPADCERLDPQVTWHKVDLLDRRAARDLVLSIGATHALHLAWYSGGDVWVAAENREWFAATVDLGRALIESGCKRLVVAGSCAEYAGSGMFAESSVSTPTTPYGSAKAAARHALLSFCETQGVSFAWARLFHMYGPHEDQRRLVSGAICSLLERRMFPSTDGVQLRDFMHVRDVGGALVHLLASDVDGIINIGSGQTTSIAALLGIVERTLDRPGYLALGTRPRAVNDPDIIIPDLTRQRAELRWQPTYSLERGIADTVQWWQARLVHDQTLS